LSDIEKVFLQVGIQESERDVTRFLWFKDPTRPDRVIENLSLYRFCRVPFGIVCSPLLCNAPCCVAVDSSCVCCYEASGVCIAMRQAVCVLLLGNRN